jgi:hypothetical protein
MGALSYLESVELLARTRTDLDPLVNFIKRPLGFRTKECIEHFDVEFLLVGGEQNALDEIRCCSEDEFHAAATTASGASQLGMVVIVEDLSNTVIEVLGKTFELQPEFFASHLRGSDTFWTGKYQPRSLPYQVLPPSRLRNTPYYTIETRRPYYFEGGWDQTHKLRASGTNVPRGCTRPLGFPLTYMNELISVYGTSYNGIKTGKFAN